MKDGNLDMAMDRVNLIIDRHKVSPIVESLLIDIKIHLEKLNDTFDSLEEVTFYRWKP